MRLKNCIVILIVLLSSSWCWAKRPNILFAISDDQSFPHAGAYGCKWVKTPAFDRVARDGILFNNAYTPNAKCAPSRACILTGRNSWQLEAAGNHMPFWPQKFKTYAEVLAEHGYHVGATQKTWSPGDPGKINGKRRELCGKVYNTHTCRPPARMIAANDYAENFRQFLDACPQGEPFCFWYGSTEPHRAYEYGAGVKKAGKRLDEIDKVFEMWPDNEVTRNDMLDYAFEIEYFDSHLDKMLTLLEERGELDNTLVIVTADNGMPFPRIKGQEYEYSNHLPLAIMWPKGIKNPGRVYEGFVNFIDFTPTYLELADIAESVCGMQAITGQSLKLIFDDMKHERRDHVLIGKEKHDVGRPHDAGYPIRGIVKGDYLLVHNYQPDRWPAGNPETGYLNCDGSPTKTEILNMNRSGENTWYWQMSFGKRSPIELYHRITDPLCLQNLAYDKEQAKRVATMTSLMEKELRLQQDPRSLGHKNIFESYPNFSTQLSNYYERMMGGEDVKANWVEPTDYEKPRIKLYLAPSPGDLSDVEGLQESQLFDVAVNGQDTFVYHGFEREYNKYGYAKNGGSFVSFAFEQGQPVVEIKTTQPLKSFSLKPTLKGTRQIDDRTIRVTLEKPQKFLLNAQLAGKGTQYLVVAAETPEKDIPDKGDPSVLYLESGVHKFGRTWDPYQNGIKTVYLESGAVVQATIRTVGKDHLKLLGRGVFAQSIWQNGKSVDPLKTEWMADMMGMHFRECDHLTVDGITVVNCPSYQLEVADCENVIIRNVKLLGLGESNNDGTHLYGRNILLEDSFLAGSDDRICITGLFDREKFEVTKKAELQPRLEDTDVYNLHIRNIVFWGQKNGADVMLTWNGGKTCHDVIVEDVYSLTSTNKAFVAAQHGGSVMLEDMTFRNVHLYHPNLIDIEVKQASCWGTGGGAVRNLLFENVILDVEPQAVKKEILGHNPTSNVQGIIFRNVKANGQHITQIDQTRIKTNEFVKGITFE